MNKWNTDTAEWYADKYGEYATNRLGIEALQFSSDSVVVDIGCGTGCALRHALKKVTNGTLIGVDPVPRMVEIAREQTERHSADNRIVYYQGGAESLPIETSSADFILAFDSFDHWDDQLQGLKEVRRVLKSTGFFVVVKDGGLPNGAPARKLFLSALEDSGLTITSERDIQEGDIVFTQWVCTVNK